MQIKKFYAANLPQAVRDVRKVLGVDAIILSTRQLTTEDKAVILGGGARATVEVTAVRDTPEVAEILNKNGANKTPKPQPEEPQKAQPEPKQERVIKAHKPHPLEQSAAPKPQGDKPIAKESVRFRPMRTAQPQMPEALGDTDLRSKLMRSASQAWAARTANRRATTATRPEPHPVEKKMQAQHRDIPKQDVKRADNAKRESVRNILKDLRDLSGRLDGVDTKTLNESQTISAGARAGLRKRAEDHNDISTNPYPKVADQKLPNSPEELHQGTRLPARPLLDHLRRQGVDVVLARRLVDRMHFMNPTDREFLTSRPGSDPRGTFARLVSAARDFGAAESATTDQNAKRRIALVGPTGVGKTTTIAKIASIDALEQGRSVALITLDTYRVAATEQLETYARLLGVPVTVASNADELKQALKTYEKMDTVLIDTPGHSPTDSTALERLGAMLGSCADLEIHLVLTATQRQAEMRRTLDNFRPLHYDQIIFSKTDEAVEWGELLNTWIMSGFPVSYFTTGQRVPEDLEDASVERVCRNLATKTQE